jgi:hypothetical protein
MDADEILDGLALWDEHKPQTGEDWVKVAERFIAAGETTEESSPLFAAVVQAVREKLAAEQQRDRLLKEIAKHRRSYITARYWKANDRRLYKLAEEVEKEKER